LYYLKIYKILRKFFLPHAPEYEVQDGINVEKAFLYCVKIFTPPPVKGQPGFYPFLFIDLHCKMVDQFDSLILQWKLAYSSWHWQHAT